jgi:CRISPR-associated endonuclease Csy4
MKCYIEITLLPSEEIPVYFLWEKVYQQLHLALVEVQGMDNRVNIGVSFPHYDAELYQLGCKLRLFADMAVMLDKLNISKWLSRLKDYVHITSVRFTPTHVNRYAVFKRIQPQISNERLARRKAKRDGITLDQALNHFTGRKKALSRMPFIHIKSQSSGKQYCLFIAKEITQHSESSSKFSTYGLSSTNAIPLF